LLLHLVQLHIFCIISQFTPKGGIENYSKSLLLYAKITKAKKQKENKAHAPQNLKTANY